MILQRNQYELVDIFFSDMSVKTDRGAGMETIITLLVVDISNNVCNLELLVLWTSPSFHINTKYIFEFKTRGAVTQNLVTLNVIYQGWTLRGWRMSLVRLALVAFKNIISVVDRQETKSERHCEIFSTDRRVTSNWN